MTEARLFIIPTPEVGPALMRAAMADYIADTVEASEDVTVETIAGIVTVTAHWADAEWCEQLAAQAEIARPGTRAYVAYRKDWNH